MRFLLHAKRLPRQVKSTKLGKKKATIETKNSADSATEKLTNSSSTSSSSTSMRAWGQQCSPNCGCVVRFESSVDENHNLVQIQYHAKTIVTDDKLQPIITGTNSSTTTKKPPRPLLKACTCTTLHTLAEQIVHQCTATSWSKLRNMTEFEQHRSSLAFQHSVLREHALDTADTHCFDVVEEAFTSMIRGHMPQKRVGMGSCGHRAPGSDTFERTLQRKYAPDLSKLQTEATVLETYQLTEELYNEDKTESQSSHETRRDADRRRRRGYGVDRNVSMSTTRSALNFLRLDSPKDGERGELGQSLGHYDESRSSSPSLLDLIDGSAADDQEAALTGSGARSYSSATTLTWENYVDELYHQYSERPGREQSA